MFTNPSSERPSYIEQLRAESRGLQYKPAKRNNLHERLKPSPEDSRRLFTVENGNRWMELARREPAAKMLLGELWHQNELCMLFADTNIGKSVLAVQIGESIARGQSIAPFACQVPPANVLYIDFELSRTQFGLRYSKGSEDHLFSKNFFRAEYNFIPDPPPGVDENDLLIAAIEYKVQQVKATVLIIDNITCLRGGTENSAVALSLMKSLKALKNDHKLSILVLAHTPKRRNDTQPISADDLHGSKLLINFADSAFAIGKSTANADLCYLKQIKQRNTRQRYGHDNVCLCRIQKPGAFLHFKFEGYSAERHHLLSRNAATRQQFTNKMAVLSAAGLSQRDISKQLGIALATVNRLLHTGAPMTNNTMTNDQKRCADEEEYADMQICECANDSVNYASNTQKECHTEAPEVRPELGTTHERRLHEGHTAAQIPANPPITDNRPANDPKDLEGSPGTQSLYEPVFRKKTTPAVPPITNDILTNDHPTNHLVTCDQIDALLTPELLAHILRNTKLPTRGDITENLCEPNSKADNDGP